MFQPKIHSSVSAFVYLLIYFLKIDLVFGQQAAEDPINKSIKPDSLLQHSASGLALPIVFYSPETRSAAGVVGIYSFRLPNSSMSSRASSIKADAIYTQLSQLFLQFQPQIYLQNEAYYIDADFSFIRFSDKFWGIGNTTQFSDEEKYKNEIVRFRVTLFHQFLQRLFIGIQYHNETFTMLEVSPNGALAQNESISGREGSKNKGIGVLINYDTRDNPFSPVSGSFYQASALNYTRNLGSSHDFRIFTFDVRRFFSLKDQEVLAFQGYFSFVTGDAPFQMLPRLGGSTRMRGFYEGRFRDKQLLTLQNEYRRPLFWRFGLAGFIAAGSVSESLNDMALQRMQFACGVGLRFAITPEERVFARVDFGVGAGTYGFYVQVNEAF